MSLIKVECSECDWTAESAEPDEDWDDIIEMEFCPGCAEKVLEEL
jgi:NAD-dependent SIR2 family protein deacetylase